MVVIEIELFQESIHGVSEESHRNPSPLSVVVSTISSNKIATSNSIFQQVIVQPGVPPFNPKGLITMDENKERDNVQSNIHCLIYLIFTIRQTIKISDIYSLR